MKPQGESYGAFAARSYNSHIISDMSTKSLSDLPAPCVFAPHLMDGILKILNDLTEEETSQLSDKQKKAVKALISSKPCVPFHKATLNDCVRPDGLALNIDCIRVKAPTLHIPVDFAAPIASAHLCETLANIDKVWVLDNEKSCRIVIDVILTEVLLDETNHELMGFCEVKNDWEGTGFGYTGDVDYMFGSSKTKSVDTMDSFLLIVQAKCEWPAKSVAQTLVEAGCLLKKRLAAGKNTPVFAILTNGTDFRFFAIDTDGVVYASDKEVLKLGEDGTYKSSSSLSEILRWFTWFMTAIISVSPSNVDLTNDSLTKLRSCFGPNNTTSSKKLKIQK